MKIIADGIINSYCFQIRFISNRSERLDDAVSQIQAIMKAEQQRVRPRRISL